MKLTKSLIFAMLASSTLWAQAPTNQVISNAKSLVSSAGQPHSTAPAQATAKPSATNAKVAPAKATAASKPNTVTAHPISVPAKQPVPAAKTTQSAAVGTKPATKPTPVDAKHVAPVKATKAAPTVATKAAPVATKPAVKAVPEKKAAIAEPKKPVEAKKPTEAKKESVAKVAPKNDGTPTAVAKPASAKEATTSRVSSMVGKRDPFVSPIVRASAGGPACETGKRCLMVDQIELKGIVKSPSGFIAVVENPMKRAYFLRENDPVFNGSVVKITTDTVVFRESTTDKLGKQGMREVVKKVNAPVV